MRINIRAVIVLVVSVICIFLLPIVAVPCVLLVGILWRTGPLWTRLSMIAAGVVTIGYYALLWTR